VRARPWFSHSQDSTTQIVGWQAVFAFYNQNRLWYYRAKEAEMNAAELVKLIHETPHKAVMAITGGGSEAIGELLRHGNGSKTLLEAVVPYDQGSFEEARPW
jgi:hypothetical protein